MSRFAIRNPYLIIVICLVLTVIGATSLARMPVDLFPTINLPEVVVATFYSGMPPEDIETDITDPLERFLRLPAALITWSLVPYWASALSRCIFSREPVPTPM